jgi:chromosome segregation ATPase
MSTDWKQTLYAARKEHGELIQQRDVLDSQQAELDAQRDILEKRILQLQKTIESLSELVGENSLSRALSRATLGGAYDHLKLAEAIRKVLQSTDNYWSPVKVRDALVAQQYDLSGYTNALASIHAVLKRIFESGEALRIAGADGKAMYRWKSQHTLNAETGTFKVTGGNASLTVSKSEKGSK